MLLRWTGELRRLLGALFMHTPHAPGGRRRGRLLRWTPELPHLLGGLFATWRTRCIGRRRRSGRPLGWRSATRRPVRRFAAVVSAGRIIRTQDSPHLALVTPR